MNVPLRRISLALGVSSSLVAAANLGAGCASGNDNQGSHSLGGGGSAGGSGPGANGPGSGGSGGSIAGAGGGSGGAPACAKFTDQAKALPAAMLIVLDMSASMKVKVNGVPKYQLAEQAIVTAIDNDAFDNTAIGLLIFPDHKVDAPPCLGLPPSYKVSCGYPMMPQIPPADSGTLKSSDTAGVRHNIAGFLAGATPLGSADDGSPDYEALEGAYTALQAYPAVDKRFAILVSDGGFSCTSLSNPLREGYSDGMCPDWEEPDTVNALISGAYQAATNPVNTFIVGVPGSNTNGGMSGLFANAPYPMMLALSTYAVSGSPDTVDPTCDKTAVFTKTGAPPNFPCHIDLSNGPQFSSDALAHAIAKVRGQALGCVFDLPDPPHGQTIDFNLVNVILTIDGTKTTVPKRSSPSDMCATDDCWDYNDAHQVVLIGKACSDLSAAATSAVEIEVGCKTIVK